LLAEYGGSQGASRWRTLSREGQLSFGARRPTAGRAESSRTHALMSSDWDDYDQRRAGRISTCKPQQTADSSEEGKGGGAQRRGARTSQCANCAAHLAPTTLPPRWTWSSWIKQWQNGSASSERAPGLDLVPNALTLSFTRSSRVSSLAASPSGSHLTHTSRILLPAPRSPLSTLLATTPSSLFVSAPGSPLGPLVCGRECVQELRL
jgi:hypothetical protein